MVWLLWRLANRLKIHIPSRDFMTLEALSSFSQAITHRPGGTYGNGWDLSTNFCRKTSPKTKDGKNPPCRCTSQTKNRVQTVTNKQCTRKLINLSNTNPNRNLMSRRRSAAQRGQLSRKNVSNKPKMVKTLVTYYKRLGRWCLAGRLGCCGWPQHNI